ncbi:hypothetical protein H0R92_05630 [Treponema sp. OMZ 840]|uniref:WG repeat-containing protein n=1 Tax=Treponema sp. OMZ 840 TaxID=244313 RepID=UPI003D8CAD1B
MRKIISIVLFALVFFNACAQTERRLLIPFTLNEKVGFIDQHMKLVYPAEFSRLLELSGEFALVQKEKKNTWGKFLIDSHGKCRQIDIFYDFGFLPNDLYYIHASQSSCSNPILNLRIPKGGTMVYHLYSDEKKLLRYVQLFTSSTIDFINAVITDPNSPHLFRKTYVNIKGEPSFPNIYRSVCGYFNENEEATYISSEKWRGDFRILTKDGEIRENYIFDSLTSFYSGLSFGLRQKDKALGFFDTYGELKIPLKVLPGTKDYDNYHFEDGIAPALLIDGSLYAVFYHQRYVSKNWCLINTEGKIIKSGIEAAYISPFYKGVSIVCNKNDKYALMKNDGTFITDFILEDANPAYYFVEGICEGKDVLIDRKNGKMYYCENFK